MNCIIYARVSSKEQEAEGYSIPSQLKLLKEYTRAKGLKIVKTYSELGLDSPVEEGYIDEEGYYYELI